MALEDILTTVWVLELETFFELTKIWKEGALCALAPVRSQPAGDRAHIYIENLDSLFQFQLWFLQLSMQTSMARLASATTHLHLVLFCAGVIPPAGWTGGRAQGV